MNQYYRDVDGQVLFVTATMVPNANVDRGVSEGQAGIWFSDVEERQARGQKTTIAQLAKLVLPSLIDSRHIFQGLCRPLFCDGQNTADETKLIAT